MVTAYKWYLHGILLPSGAWISQLTDTTPAANVNFLTEYAAGAAAPSFRGAQGAKPEIAFTTTAIKQILDLCGFWGADLSAGNVDLYYRAATKRGVREAITDLDHLRIRCVQSYLGWSRITAAQDQPATIACRLVPLYDGTNPPLVGLGSQAIPAVSLVAEQYTLGPVTVNGAATPGGITAWDLDLQPKYDEEASDGEDYLSWIGVERHEPNLTVTLRGLGDWAAIGIPGAQLTALVAYLRKRQPDLVRCYADGSNVHIKIYAADNPCGLATLDTITDGGQKAAQTKLRCGLRVSSAATDYPLLKNTAIAIT